MATKEGVGSWIAKGVHRQLWENLTEADEGGFLDAPHLPDKTIHIFGDFGTGGRCDIEVSNDGTNWVLAEDLQGSVIQPLAEDVVVVQENARFMRPNIGAGTSVDLDVIIISRAAPR